MSNQYAPLSHIEVLDNDAEDSLNDPLLSDGNEGPSRKETPGTQRWFEWATIFLSCVAVASACALYGASARMSSPVDVRRLAKPDQYPGLWQVPILARKMKAPAILFPGAIVRANAAQPDEVYQSSSHVVLSDTDSMFYQWHLSPSTYKSCYIDAVVPTLEKGRLSNKTYTSSGPLDKIQIWNVTTPAKRLTGLSWSTRPERVALLGTVAFYPEQERMELLGLDDGWQLNAPTPRFDCGEKETYTIEATCEGCRLEFEQLFSEPPLAFDLIQIG